MSRQSTHTLEFLQKMAADEVEAAMRVVAHGMQQVEQAKQQLQVLMQYQLEYQQQWQTAMQHGLKVEMYHNFQGFFTQLELAVQGQNAQIAQMESVVEQRKLELQEKQRKQKSYEVLITRAMASRQKLERRRDQKMMDEFASRAKRTSGY